MKKVKRIIRILAFVGLVLLAGIGVGISGGVPVPLSNRRKDSEKENMELIDTENEKPGSQQGRFKF